MGLFLCLNFEKAVIRSGFIRQQTSINGSEKRLLEKIKATFNSFKRTF